MNDWDLDDLSNVEMHEAELLANEMLLILGRRESDIDVAWAAIDMVTSVMQDMEEEILQNETHGLNGKEI